MGPKTFPCGLGLQKNLLDFTELWAELMLGLRAESASFTRLQKTGSKTDFIGLKMMWAELAGSMGFTCGWPAQQKFTWAVGPTRIQEEVAKLVDRS